MTSIGNIFDCDAMTAAAEQNPQLLSETLGEMRETLDELKRYQEDIHGSQGWVIIFETFLSIGVPMDVVTTKLCLSENEIEGFHLGRDCPPEEDVEQLFHELIMLAEDHIVEKSRKVEQLERGMAPR